jgi:hypothetical protein
MADRDETVRALLDATTQAAERASAAAGRDNSVQAQGWAAAAKTLAEAASAVGGLSGSVG